jgi:outer membrane protein, multidrug efflux system
MRSHALAVALAAAALLTGCTVGPKYSRAPIPAPPSWQTESPWQVAAPKDSLSKGPWWEIYGDGELNGYEQELLKANQSLTAAREALSQARSLATIATSGLFPQVSTDPSAYRTRYSGNRPEVPTGSQPLTQNVFNIPFALNYEVDLFGAVRRNVEAGNAQLQSTAADLANSQLVLTAELAADYFSLRELDAEAQVVRDTILYQQKAMDLINRRHEGGVASGLDVAQQAAVLDASRTQLSQVLQSRARFEHAIAVLTGTSAAEFKVPVAPLHATPPPVPLGVPSDMLERRPDVASFERSMAYQNAQVGIATAAFYPHITLSASGGVQSTSISKLFSTPSAFWSIGADALQPILQGGRLRANLAANKSAYNQSVANYRQTVLTAFQQVEDGLSDLDWLAKASETQHAAVVDSQRALDIANNRYVGGVTFYLDVITAETTLLSNQRLETQLLGQQMVASVALVKALGGGWDGSQIQNEQVHPRAIQVVQQ